MQLLNIIKADHYPKATEHIQDMLTMIDTLIEKSHAYTHRNSVYFRVKSFPQYGDFARINLAELRNGSGHGKLKLDSIKEDPLDFAMWKGCHNRVDYGWESKYGRGRPGTMRLTLFYEVMSQ